MHFIQEKIIQLMAETDISKMTLREIGQKIGVGDTPQKIKHHIGQLAKKGLIKIDKSRNTIAPSKGGEIKNTNLFAIPIFGAANCGQATFFADNQVEGYLTVSHKLLLPNVLKHIKKIFAIKAVGHSMNRTSINDKSIEDGDYVLIDGTSFIPKDGDCVLSVINDVANIKRFVKDDENQQIALISESTQEFPPIYIHNDDVGGYTVSGKVVQVLKKTQKT